MRQRYKKPNLIYNTLKLSSSILDFFIKNKRFFLILILCCAVFFFVLVRFQRLFYTALLILIASVSMIYQRYSKYANYVGFELCMMSTVLTGLVYGSYFGAFTGFVSIFAALILSGNFKHSSFISVLTLPLIGAIVPFFSHLSLLYLGLLMTILYDAIILPLYVMLGSRIYSSIIFFITHVLFNYWIFSTIAPFIYNLMTI
jgi:hypothetical protein